MQPRRLLITDYNYFRDYDAQTGRYVESDPIGLKGGINTFGYANASPVVWMDAFGLSSCKCTADPNSKEHQVTNTWYLAAFHDIKCNYNCTKADGSSQIVKGGHSEWYWPRTGARGEDSGVEGLCLGHYGKMQFNQYATPYGGKEIYNADGYNAIDPETSDSADLKSWAQKNCHDCKK